MVKNPPANGGDSGNMGLIPGSERSPGDLRLPLPTCSNILAWKIPWTEQPDELRSMSLKSGTQLSMHTCTCQYVMTRYFELFQVLYFSIFTC